MTQHPPTENIPLITHTHRSSNLLPPPFPQSSAPSIQSTKKVFLDTHLYERTRRAEGIARKGRVGRAEAASGLDIVSVEAAHEVLADQSGRTGDDGTRHGGAGPLLELAGPVASVRSAVGLVHGHGSFVREWENNKNYFTKMKKRGQRGEERRGWEGSEWGR